MVGKQRWRDAMCVRVAKLSLHPEIVVCVCGVNCPERLCVPSHCAVRPGVRRC